MGFLHPDTKPADDLLQSGIRCTAQVQDSEENLGMGMAVSSVGFMSTKKTEKMLAGEEAMARKKVTLRIMPPGKDAYTVTSKIPYPMMKSNWLYRGGSFQVLVDPNNPERFAVDWDGPHEIGTVADLAAGNPMIAASLKGSGIDVDRVTQQQLWARQMGAGTPNVMVNGQLMGVPPMPGAAPAAPAHESSVDQLAKLAELHSSGALSDEEFAAEKAKILNS